MREKVKHILAMVEEGKISAEQAEQLRRTGSGTAENVIACGFAMKKTRCLEVKVVYSCAGPRIAPEEDDLPERIP